LPTRRSSNTWIPDPWQTGREWAEPMAEALLDLGMACARVGVAGLNGGALTHCRSIDGVVNHAALVQVMAKVPNASFDDATDVIGLARFVKSEEEIFFIRESTQVASAGLEELISAWLGPESMRECFMPMCWRRCSNCAVNTLL
jgi:Xaa-Pro aminopeptidase